MQIKSIFLLLFIVVGLWAKQAAQDVEVLAESVNKELNRIHARGNVVLYSQKYLITADEAYYDQENGDLELFGNITMREGMHYATRSGHAKLNLNTDKGVSDPFFFFDESSNVWMKCENALLTPDSYIAQQSIVSSCNTQNPDWKIAFTTGEFNKESKWLHLYNTVFYADEIPVFYLPYFSFTTDKTRRTGLLRPDFGMSSSEGFHYLQPIYFAPDVNWDLELRPQIRTDRGEGLHGTYRFVDSAYSTGEMTLGYFGEQSQYAKKENLKNNSHYGYHLMYDRSKLLSEKYQNLEDGLWVDINYLNDIDYYNTMTSESKSYDKLAVSRLNYYVKQDQNYAGIYAKYYIDTSKISNKDTLQELPTLHYHHFTSPLLLDNLLYSVDYKAKNYDRKEGVTALQNEVRTPLTFYFNTLNDYLHMSVSENIYMSHVSYGQEDNDGSYGQVFNNYHKFNVYTDVAKAYDDFFHTLYVGIDHTVPSYRKTQGTWSYKYGEDDLIPLEQEEKKTALQFKQFFYDMDGEKKLSHFVKQAYKYDKDYKYSDLENDIKYYISNTLYIGDKTHYSHEYSQISRNQISLTYHDSLFTNSMRYTIVDKIYEDNKEGKDFSYVTLSTETRYFENISLFAAVNYDVKEDIFKSWSLGVKKMKKCWDYSLVYRDTTEPKQTSAGIDSVSKQGIMLMFNLYPMGNVGYEIATKESEQRL